MRSVLLALLFACPTVRAQYLGFWERRPKLATARQEVAAAVLNGKVYVGGGLLANRSATASVEVYDPKTEKWGRIPDLPMRLHHFGMCALGGKLYQLGGYVNNSFTPTALCHSYDPATGKWTQVVSLPLARGAFVAVVIADKIYAVGGVEQLNGVTGRLTVYDPKTDKWTILSPMPTAREHLGAAAIDGVLYVAGGRRGVLYNQLEAYDPKTDRWTRLPAMPTARGGNGAAALAGKLIVAGGEGPRIYPEVEEYDPKTRKWTKLANMIVPMHGIYPVTIGNEVFVAGGATSPGYAAVNDVISFRYLPDGVERYGVSTSACKGAISAEVTSAPVAGQSFQLVSSPAGPPASPGLLVLGATADRAGTVLLGLRLHVLLAPPLLLLNVVTDASGESRVPLFLPAATRGARVFGQFVWVNPATCLGPAPLSASDALDLTIR